MLASRFSPTDIPGVYLNVGVDYTLPDADWRLIVLVFAVAWLVSWTVMVTT